MCDNHTVSYINIDVRQRKNTGSTGSCNWLLSRGGRSGASYQRWVGGDVFCDV